MTSQKPIELNEGQEPMKYVMRCCFSGPEGQHEGTFYWIATTEMEMNRWIHLDFGDHTTVTCVGPAQSPPTWMLERVFQIGRAHD